MKRLFLPGVGALLLIISGCQMPNMGQMSEKINEKLAKIDVMNEKIENLELKIEKMQEQIDDLEERVVIIETKLEQNAQRKTGSNTSYQRSERSASPSKNKTKKKIR